MEAIRVRQFKEPPEFMSLFGGEIIIRSGVRSAFSHAISLYHSLIASVNYFFFYELSQMIFFSLYSSFFKIIGKRSALRRKILRQYALFRISSCRPGLSHVIQIADQPSPHHLSLFDSNSCFVVQAEANVFVWIGEKSARSDVERGTQTFLFSMQLCNFLIENFYNFIFCQLSP